MSSVEKELSFDILSIFNSIFLNYTFAQKLHEDRLATEVVVFLKQIRIVMANRICGLNLIGILGPS